jgi:hypothetical protein
MVVIVQLMITASAARTRVVHGFHLGQPSALSIGFAGFGPEDANPLTNHRV